MTDPYFEWLEEQARVDDRIQRAERAQARRDRLDDYAPLIGDARAAVTAGRLVPHGSESM